MKRLDRDRFAPNVVAGTGEGFLVESVRALGIPLRFVRTSRANGKLATISAVRAILSAHADIVHAYNFTGNTWGQLARLCGCRAKLIAGVRGYEPLTAIQARLQRSLIRLPTVTVANTHGQAHDWIQLGARPERVEVIPNGVDLDRFPWPRLERRFIRTNLGLAVDRPVVGMVASFQPLKRWDVFIRAAAAVSKSRPVDVLCVGAGALRPDMEHLAKHLGIWESTHFLGLRSDVPELLPVLDLLVSASDGEGMSNSILEAMACGLPVVATAVGGSTELVVENETGFLVPPSDATAMAAAIQSVLDDAALARKLGTAARTRVESAFSLDACVQRTQELYVKVLNRVPLP